MIREGSPGEHALQFSRRVAQGLLVFLRPTFVPWVTQTPGSSPGNSGKTPHKHAFMPSMVIACRRFNVV